MLCHQDSQMLLRFRICSLGNDERDVVGMSFENTPNTLTQDRANQYMLASRTRARRSMPDYLGFRFFSRVD